MQLYDGKSSIDWVYRGTMTKSQMAKDTELKPLTEEECVLYDNGDGKVYSFNRLEVLKGIWAVTEDNPVLALNAIIDKMNEVPLTTEDNTEALAEVGELVSELTDSLAEVGELVSDLMDAVAELGSIVGGE